MRILIVAMANSIHTARWISQIADRGWDIHLFPSTDSFLDLHPEVGGVTLHHTGWRRRRPNEPGVVFRGVSFRRRAEEILRRRIFERSDPEAAARRLARVVRAVRPDIVHAMEIQHAGYLACAARKLMGGAFPPWIVTNWGSDIYLFGRLAAHEPRIREVLAACDYYSCECQRDVCLAKEYGLRGKVLPVFPNTGGFDLDAVRRLRAPGPVSARRTIVLKGYQAWAGRALVGLRALERCADALSGYEVVVHSATPDVAIAAELTGKQAGIPVRIVPKETPHREILAIHGRARISIGLSISDAISTSFLEAIVMGSFPVQSWTACADEWIDDGRTGLLVPPEDPEVVEKALRRALADDALVDGAAEENARLAAERLDGAVLKPLAVSIYTTVAGERGIRDGA
jgi:hypothetical protein